MTDSSKRALVCDLDGTLVDSLDEICEALNHVLGRAGRPPVGPEQLRCWMGDGAAELVEHAFLATGAPVEPARLPVLAAELLDFHDREPSRAAAYPGVAETLAGLRAAGWRIGLCTNKREAKSREVLYAAGLDHLIEVVIGADTVGAAKPDPRPLLAAILRLEALPAETVMVGDSVNDILVARRAGASAVACRYGYPRGEVDAFGADAVIDSFGQLPAVLVRLGAED